MALTFKGGVQIGMRKKAANKQTEIFTPQRVLLPYTEDCPLAVGDAVAFGQPIGTDARGIVWHASIAGTITEIKELGGNRYLCIESDGSGREDKSFAPADKPLSAFTAEEIIETVRRAGIFGMGGGKCTADKLASARGRVDRIIINCAESEPYASADHRILLEHPEDVINGTKILMRALSVDRAYVGIEEDKLDAATAVDRVNGQSELVRVRILKSKYPQGSEKMLVSAILGKPFPAGKTPEDLGCFVINCRTCAAVFRAFAYGESMTSVTVTVSGGGVKKAHNITLPLGTPIAEAVAHCGGAEGCTVVIGGAMNGTKQAELDAPILSGAPILCLPAKYHAPAELACIRCGRCVSACPMRLAPALIYGACAKNKEQRLARLNVDACIECGACAFVCPAHLPILEQIRAHKSGKNEPEQPMPEISEKEDAENAEAEA